MKTKCFWEHNGDDSLLYSTEYLGAFTRGKSVDIAKLKMPQEIKSFIRWSGINGPNFRNLFLFFFFFFWETGFLCVALAVLELTL